MQFFNRAKKNRTSNLSHIRSNTRRSGKWAPQMEQLESRQLMAADVMVEPADTGELVITGNDLDNRVNVYRWYGDIVVHDHEKGVIASVPSAQVDRVVFHGMAGNDYFLNYTNLPSTAYGGPGRDKLIGGKSSDVFFGGRDDDDLHGKEGNDVIRGDEGSDSIYGGPGSDFLDGGIGYDWVEDSDDLKFGDVDGYTGTGSRLLADINGDGSDDIIGIKKDAVVTKLSSFRSSPVRVDNLQPFASWNVATDPITTADVNGDGKADLVGFGSDGVYVSLSQSSGWKTEFGPITRVTDLFSEHRGWGNASDVHMADVNGDGRDDIVGFKDDGVHVALSNTSSHRLGTDTASFIGRSNAVLREFGGGQWSSIHNPRMLADVNGDGKADIVGFGGNGVRVSFSTSTNQAASFEPSNNPTNDEFGSATGWRSWNSTRDVVDINNDGKADIVGIKNTYSKTHGSGAFIHTAVSVGDDFSAPILTPVAKMTAGQIQSLQWTPKQRIGDVDGDGNQDVVLFANGRVYVGVSQGNGKFNNGEESYNRIGGVTIDSFRHDLHTVSLADMNADGMADIVGFGIDDVYSHENVLNLRAGHNAGSIEIDLESKRVVVRGTNTDDAIHVYTELACGSSHCHDVIKVRITDTEGNVKKHQADEFYSIWDATYGDWNVDIRGNNGNDNITFSGTWPRGKVNLRLDGGVGNDTLTVIDSDGLGFGRVDVYGGPGADLIDAERLRSSGRFRGGPGDDVIHGPNAFSSSYLFGDSGDDEIWSHASEITSKRLDGDKLYGGSGDDRLTGGVNADYLSGGKGNDYLEGQGGRDSLFGHDGQDKLYGGAGADALYPGAGFDYVLKEPIDYVSVSGSDRDVIEELPEEQEPERWSNPAAQVAYFASAAWMGSPAPLLMTELISGGLHAVAPGVDWTVAVGYELSGSFAGFSFGGEAGIFKHTPKCNNPSSTCDADENVALRVERGLYVGAGLTVESSDISTRASNGVALEASGSIIVTAIVGKPSDLKGTAIAFGGTIDVKSVSIGFNVLTNTDFEVLGFSFSVGKTFKTIGKKQDNPVPLSLNVGAGYSCGTDGSPERTICNAITGLEDWLNGLTDLPSMGSNDASNPPSAKATDQLMAAAIHRRPKDVSNGTDKKDVTIKFEDLTGKMLGKAVGSTIDLDTDASGLGWSVDETPYDDDEEFTLAGDQGEKNRVDLLSVLAHELGHIGGEEHAVDGVMRSMLAPGARHL